MSFIDNIYDELDGMGFTDTLHIGDIPEREDGVWIVQDPSPTPDPAIGYYESHISIWARFRKTDKTQEVLEDIFEFLHRRVNWLTDDYLVYLSAANSLIDDMGRDIENRKMMRISMRFIYRNLEDIS